MEYHSCKLFSFGHFSVIDWNVSEMIKKKLSHFGQNVWKYSLKNTAMVSFNATMRQMTEMFQWPKWPKCFSEKKCRLQVCPGGHKGGLQPNKVKETKSNKYFSLSFLSWPGRVLTSLATRNTTHIHHIPIRYMFTTIWTYLFSKMAPFASKCEISAVKNCFYHG